MDIRCFGSRRFAPKLHFPVLRALFGNSSFESQAQADLWPEHKGGARTGMLSWLGNRVLLLSCGAAPLVAWHLPSASCWRHVNHSHGLFLQVPLKLYWCLNLCFSNSFSVCPPSLGRPAFYERLSCNLHTNLVSNNMSPPKGASKSCLPNRVESAELCLESWHLLENFVVWFCAKIVEKCRECLDTPRRFLMFAVCCLLIKRCLEWMVYVSCVPACCVPHPMARRCLGSSQSPYRVWPTAKVLKWPGRYRTCVASEGVAILCRAWLLQVVLPLEDGGSRTSVIAGQELWCVKLPLMQWRASWWVSQLHYRVPRSNEPLNYKCLLSDKRERERGKITTRFLPSRSKMNNKACRLLSKDFKITPQQQNIVTIIWIPEKYFEIM